MAVNVNGSRARRLIANRARDVHFWIKRKGRFTLCSELSLLLWVGGPLFRWTTRFPSALLFTVCMRNSFARVRRAKGRAVEEARLLCVGDNTALRPWLSLVTTRVTRRKPRKDKNKHLSVSQLHRDHRQNDEGGEDNRKKKNKKHFYLLDVSSFGYVHVLNV